MLGYLVLFGCVVVFLLRGVVAVVVRLVAGKIKAAVAAILTYNFVKLSKYLSVIDNFKLSNSINFADSFLVTAR